MTDAVREVTRWRPFCPPHRRAEYCGFGRYHCTECDVEVRPAPGGGWMEGSSPAPQCESIPAHGTRQAIRAGEVTPGDDFYEFASEGPEECGWYGGCDLLVSEDGLCAFHFDACERAEHADAQRQYEAISHTAEFCADDSRDDATGVAA